METLAQVIKEAPRGPGGIKVEVRGEFVIVSPELEPEEQDTDTGGIKSLKELITPAKGKTPVVSLKG